MRNFFVLLLVSSLLFACSFKNQLTYINNGKDDNVSKINFSKKNYIEIGDVLKIDVKTVVAEVSAPYNNLEKLNNTHNANKLILEGYNVAKDSTINYPFFGKITAVGLTTNELAEKLRNMFIINGQLTNPYITINIVNSKFTVLGEVQSPGTYFNYENQLNIFQALGFAGDLLITAKRNNVKLIRQENGLRKTYEFSLNKQEIFDKPYYYIKSNDVIIIEPNFSKIKSAGFIGSPASIASISSLVLSITLLLINNN
jgi:polysaccharide export outer membrane protein